MSIIALEGFDLYGPISGDPNTDPETSLISRSDLWGPGAHTIALPVYAARNGGHAAALRDQINFSGQPGFVSTVTNPYGKSYAHTFGGIAVKSDPFTIFGLDDRMPYIVYIVAGTSVHLKAKKTTETGDNFNIELGIGAVKIHVAQVADGVWHYVEWELTVTPGVSIAYKVWVNGSLQAEGSEAHASAAAVIRWSIGGCIRTLAGYYDNALWLDDMYLLDADDASDGPGFQQRLGPISIRPMVPVADGASGFSPVGAASNWETVNESPGPSDKDATYCETSIAPSIQSFMVQAIDTGLPIVAVTAFASVKQDEPSSGIAKLVWHANDGNTQQDAEPTVLQNVYRMLTNDYVTMPNGSAFTTASIEAAQWGIELHPDES